MAVPALKQLYRDTLVEAADLFDRTDGTAPPDVRAPGWLEREAARLLELIRPAVAADPVKPYTSAEFEDAASQVLTVARTRGAFVREEAGRRWPVY